MTGADAFIVFVEEFDRDDIFIISWILVGLVKFGSLDIGFFNSRVLFA